MKKSPKSAPKPKATKSAPAKPVVKDQKEAAAVPIHSNDQKEAAANPTKKRPNIVSAEGFAWYGMSGWWKDEYATLKPATLASLLEAKKAPSSRLIDSLRRAANPLTAPVPARPVSQQPVKSAPVAVSKPSPTRTPPKPVRTAPAAAPATEPPGPEPITITSADTESLLKPLVCSGITDNPDDKDQSTNRILRVIHRIR